MAALEEELAAFTAEKEACEAALRELRAREDPAKGVFLAQEIFARQQDKLRLEVEMEFRRKAINRLRMDEPF
jgi:hypothetical protein